MFCIGVDNCASELEYQIQRNAPELVINSWKESLKFEIKSCYKQIKGSKESLGFSEIKETLSILKSTCREFSLNFKEIVK